MARERGVPLGSRQRALLMNILQQSRDHPTAQSVHEQARRQMPSISLGTVYRNLRLLVQEGWLRENRIGNKPARFEWLSRRHYHVWCLECGRLEDLPLPYQSRLDRRVERLVPYRLREHRMEFYGVCPQCRRRSRTAGRPQELTPPPVSPDGGRRRKRNTRVIASTLIASRRREKNGRATHGTQTRPKGPGF